MPRVSVIAALYNHERYVAQAIESVLAQTFRDWELIVWDDGSTDRSLEIAQGYAERAPERVRVFTHPHLANLGQERTRNASLEKAAGELVSLLDTDDFYDPRKLELLVPCMEDPEAGLAYGKAMIVVEPGSRRIPSGVRREPGGYVFDDLVLDNFLFAGATLFRRRFVEQGMRFDPAFRTCGEYPLWLEIARDWKLAHVPRVVAYWRSHGANLGSRLSLTAKAELVALRERLAGDPAYAAHLPAVSRALARSHYDYACELYAELDLEGARQELLRALSERAVPGGVLAKAAILFAATGLGEGPNRALSRWKRRIWEARHPLRALFRARRGAGGTSGGGDAADGGAGSVGGE